MRAGGEERGPFPGVFYKRFRKWPICFGRSDYVSLSGPQMFPSLWFPTWISALLGLPSPIKALIMQSSLYELNSLFHFFLSSTETPTPIFFSLTSFSTLQRKEVWQLQRHPWFIPKMFTLCQRNVTFFPGKLLTNELASLLAIWGLLPWGTMRAG